jgi:signal transduction histidine kinase
MLVPRLGEYLVEEQIIREEDLKVALDYQKKQAKNKNPILLGQSLIYFDFVDQPTLDKAITAQILRLQAAIRKANRDLEHRVQERTAELRNALSKLSELNQLKTNFISNISHELRTPLTHIVGYIELLNDTGFGPLTTQQSDALLVMSTASDRLGKLINDLIKFSESAAGSISLQLAQVNINGLVDQIVKRSLEKATQRGINLEAEYCSEKVTVIADEENLSWALIQLLDNAIKFTPIGGKVIVSCQCDDILVSIAVTDTGIGIAQEKIDEIFIPFHQLDSSSTRRYGGTGMGLTLAKHIIEAHDSFIDVQSKLGEGSKFQFSLPLVTNQEKQVNLDST